MHIGIDARSVYHRQAGIWRYTVRLTQALAQVDTQNAYWLLQHRRHPTPLVTAPNFRRVTMYAPTHHPLEQFMLRLELHKVPLDVLHSPDFIPPLHFNSVRRVITVHDLAFLRYPHLLTKAAARYYGQIDRAVRKADHIIAVSCSTCEDLMNLLGVPEEKISVIYEAADPIFAPMPREEALAHLREHYDLPADFILFVGTVEPRKNLNTLFLAYHLLRHHYHLDPALVIAGERGWLTEEVYTLVEELDLSDRCLFLGGVTNEELVYLYNAAHFLVHPALYEGFGLPPLEAMACGTPVIVSNVSSLPEVVGEAALLIDPTDVEAWAVAMQQLLTNTTLREELREKGLRRAEGFSWQRTARETLDVYTRVYQA